MKCYDSKWFSYAWVVAISAVGFAFGVPLLFTYLLFNFQDVSKAGDKVVRRAIGWMHEPFRPGKEWWLCAEQSRVLLLTSCVGFLARSCMLKVLAAQLIALAYLVLFVAHRPYRRSQHQMQQMISMLLPVVTMGWVSAGGWEQSHRDTLGVTQDTEDDTTFDVMTIVVLHVAILLPPVLSAVFTLVSSIFIWAMAVKAKALEGTEKASASESAREARREERRLRRARQKRAKEKATLAAEKVAREAAENDSASWSSLSSSSSSSSGGDVETAAANDRGANGSSSHGNERGNETRRPTFQLPPCPWKKGDHVEARLPHWPDAVRQFFCRALDYLHTRTHPYY